MSEENGTPEQAQPVETEDVMLDGESYAVPKPVVREMEVLAEGLIGQIRQFKPEPGRTIVVTVPAGASRDMHEMIVNQVARQFPEYRAVVLPASLNLHTAEGLAELLSAGSEMAQAFSDEDPDGCRAAVARWDALLGAKAEQLDAEEAAED